jgi:hypothetical protein
MMGIALSWRNANPQQPRLPTKSAKGKKLGEEEDKRYNLVLSNVVLP